MKSNHQTRVEAFLHGIGRTVPNTPQVADREVLGTWGRLLLEEVFEWLRAAGLTVQLEDALDDDPPLEFAELKVCVDNTVIPDLVGMADASADISVVNTGAMSLNGIHDINILEEVDANNMLKIERGHRDPVTGKFIKPVGHPKPDFNRCLRTQ